jgi:maltose alpha-D-glucosyltransferase/alpha-amylase
MAEVGELEGLSVDRMGGEQSNTSRKIGDSAIFKLFRRLSPGIHPELEMCSFLTEVAQYPNTPPLLGAIEIVRDSGERTAIGVAHAFIRNQGDGWTYTLDYLKRLLDEVALHPETVPETGADQHDVYLTLIRMLGIRTAELHRALACRPDDPAFRPEPTTAADVAAWQRQVLSQARAAFAAIRWARKFQSDSALEAVDLLLRMEKQTIAYIKSLLPATTTVMKTRFHGDLHLGQVIVVQKDVHIIDFEGEPARPLAKRRHKSSPLRDVSSMLRSLDYAAWSALLENANLKAAALTKLQPWVADWQSRACTSFIEGYRATIGDCPSFPAEPAVADALTDVFTLEKAFYEICYEATNRPDWLRIPVLGVLRLLQARS